MEIKKWLIPEAEVKTVSVNGTLIWQANEEVTGINLSEDEES